MDLNICMAADDNYAVHLGTCIISIVENNCSNNINMHILNNNISDSNLRKIKSLESKFPNLKIKLYNILEYFEENKISDSEKILIINQLIEEFK